MAEDTLPAPPSILLADDDPSVLQLLGLALGRAGHTVTTARDGTEAIAALETQRFNLLVLDIMMPGATGWEVVARAIEGTPEGIPLPKVVLVTGFNGEYVLDFQLLQDEGVSAMLLKPFSAADFIEEVDRVLALEPHYTLPEKTRKAAAR